MFLKTSGHACVQHLYWSAAIPPPSAQYLISANLHNWSQGCLLEFIVWLTQEISIAPYYRIHMSIIHNSWYNLTVKPWNLLVEMDISKGIHDILVSWQNFHTTSPLCAQCYLCETKVERTSLFMDFCMCSEWLCFVYKLQSCTKLVGKPWCETYLINHNFVNN